MPAVPCSGRRSLSRPGSLSPPLRTSAPTDPSCSHLRRFGHFLMWIVCFPVRVEIGHFLARSYYSPFPVRVLAVFLHGFVFFSSPVRFLYIFSHECHFHPTSVRVLSVFPHECSFFFASVRDLGVFPHGRHELAGCDSGREHFGRFKSVFAPDATL